jgi:hypothetical protein
VSFDFARVCLRNCARGRTIESLTLGCKGGVLQVTPVLQGQGFRDVDLWDTDEYLNWNFTANAPRGTLLYALDARSPGYATDMGIVGLSKKGPKGRSSSKIPFRVPKCLLSYRPTPHCSQDCSLQPQTIVTRRA